MGNQIQSHEAYRTAVKLVHDGAIGKVARSPLVARRARWGGGWRTIGPPAAIPFPRALDWDLWLGVAPERPYKAEIYHPFNWRDWQDFSNGQLGDFGCHILDPVFMALELTAPTSVKAEAPPINQETWTKWSTVAYEFPGTRAHGRREHSRHLVRRRRHYAAARGAGPAGSVKLPGAGSVLIGEKGSLVVPHVAMPKLFPEEKFADYRDARSPAAGPLRLLGRCLPRRRTRRPATSAMPAPSRKPCCWGRSPSGSPAKRCSGTPPKMKLAGHSEASAMLTKPYRKGWEIPGIS